MTDCIGWYPRFKQNMDAVGAPVPTSLFETYDKAVATLAQLVAAASLNPSASAAAVLAGKFGASTLVVGLAALSASAYVGLIVGSMMVATSGQLECAMLSRATPLQVSAFLSKHGIYDGGWVSMEIYRQQSSYAMVA